MKKILLGACGAMLVLSACSKANEEAASSPVPRELSDSISIMYGRTVGGYVLSDFLNFSEQNTVNKDDVVKGIQMAFSHADDQGVMIGLQVGSSLLNEIKQFEATGVEIDRAKVLHNLRRVFSGDSVDMTELQHNSAEVNALLSRAQAIYNEAKAAEEANAPEAQQNRIAGKAFVDKVKAQDPSVKTTDSGLSYKIERQGETEGLTANSVVEVNYKGSLIDGTVFDEGVEGEPSVFSLAGVVPGFAEGIRLIGNGGKGTLYLPAELAYGVKGIPQAGIGPNSTLVFEVEVVGVRNN